MKDALRHPVAVVVAILVFVLVTTFLTLYIIEPAVTKTPVSESCPELSTFIDSTLDVEEQTKQMLEMLKPLAGAGVTLRIGLLENEIWVHYNDILVAAVGPMSPKRKAEAVYWIIRRGTTCAPEMAPVPKDVVEAP